MMDSDLLLRAVGALTFAVYDHATWSWRNYILFGAIIVGGLELLSRLVLLLEPCFATLPDRGKRLDRLAPLDRCYIWFNKCATILFTYHVIAYCWHAPPALVVWRLRELTAMNSLVALALLYVVYDFFYALWHRLLHWQAIYRFVHRHHHQNHACHRGNVDAINVHPIEFVVGEYDHLLTLWLVARYVMPVHFAAVAVFIVLGGVLASLNHTRFDVRLPGPLHALFSTRLHDEHHVRFNCCYSQYTMFWDHIMGTYRPYNSSLADWKGK
jgi:sterol desaturase/sphingolipid hydroxylase (fatty acid hydroxylase superfamily)